MRQYGWVIGFFLAWMTTLANTTGTQVDLLFPFAVGGMMFSSHGSIIAGSWILDGFLHGDAWIPRVAIILLIELLLNRRSKNMHLYATAVSIPYSVLTGNLLSVSIAFSLLIYMILQSGREKLIITSPSSILIREGRILYESYRDRSRARDPRPGSCQQQPQGRPHSSGDVLEAGRFSG